MSGTLQTGEGENRLKRDNERQSRHSSTSCVREGKKLEHGASFLCQMAAPNVQPLQFLMNQYSCLRHLTVRLSFLSVTRKFSQSSSAPSLNLSRWMNLKVTPTVTMLKQISEEIVEHINAITRSHRQIKASLRFDL